MQLLWGMLGRAVRLGGRVDAMKLLLAVLVVFAVAVIFAAPATNANPPRTDFDESPHENGIGDDDAPSVNLDPRSHRASAPAARSVVSNHVALPRITCSSKFDSQSPKVRMFGRVRLFFLKVIIDR